MSENPYHPPSETTEGDPFAPTRILFFGRGNLVLTGLGFGLLIFAKATRKNGFTWVMSGPVRLSEENLSRFLTETRAWVEIEQFYRTLEGFLILFPSLFLISGLGLLSRARWGVAASNVASGLSFAGASAFLGLYLLRIAPQIPILCASLGTSPRTLTLIAFASGLASVLIYSACQLLMLNRSVVKRYLKQL